MEITREHINRLKAWTDTTGAGLEDVGLALELYAYLNRHSSFDYPKKCLEIQVALNLPNRGKGNNSEADKRVRYCFRALAESGFPVASTTAGFWVAKTKQDMDRYINSFRSRIETQAHRLAIMESTQAALPDGVGNG